ncbi:MAG: type II toxin-antitoxin system VapC family toxin [Acidobacteria bacterium]|nr:type II toxin-antitoxin system VapC family toxin [Acidobacteriota bacterium]
MPQSFKDLPDGARCFLDATIFYYHLVNTPPLSDDCSDLLVRVGTGAISGVTSTVALAEAAHKVMLAEIVRRHGIAPQGLIARIKKYPELLDHLTEHQQVVALTQALQITIEPLTADLLRRGAELAPQRRLLTNDSLTLAVMEKLGVSHLATNDDDFDSIAGLTVCAPPELSQSLQFLRKRAQRLLIFR